MIIILQQSDGDENEVAKFMHDACKSNGVESLLVSISSIGKKMYLDKFSNDHTEYKNITGIFNYVFRPLSKEILESSQGTKENFIANELFDFLYGSFMSLGSNVLWMNHPAGVFVSNIKIHQLHVAKNEGFLVPDTIISHKSEELVSFWKKRNGKVITKAIHQGFLSSDKDKRKLIFTNLVEKHHLDALKETIPIPILFQEFLRKKKEYRVVVIGKKVFSCVISDREIVDWRLSEDAVRNSYIAILPTEIQKLCIKVVNKLGLNFGVLDIIETTNGSYYFLEVNQQGGWLWMDKNLGIPLSKEIVCLLALGSKTSNI